MYQPGSEAAGAGTAEAASRLRAAGGHSQAPPAPVPGHRGHHHQQPPQQQQSQHHHRHHPLPSSHRDRGGGNGAAGAAGEAAGRLLSRGEPTHEAPYPHRCVGCCSRPLQLLPLLRGWFVCPPGCASRPGRPAELHCGRHGWPRRQQGSPPCMLGALLSYSWSSVQPCMCLGVGAMELATLHGSITCCNTLCPGTEARHQPPHHAGGPRASAGSAARWDTWRCTHPQ